MIYLLKLNHIQKVNVWIDEPPNALLDGALLRCENRDASKVISSKSISVEWFIPRGARIDYGLLGIDFVSKSNCSQVNSIHSVLNPEEYESTIVHKSVIAPVIGVPTEYISGIMSEISNYYSAREGRVPKGELIIKYGASCPFYSNLWIFKLSIKFLLLALDCDNELNQARVESILSSGIL